MQLRTKLTLDSTVCKSPNLTDRFSEEDLSAIGSWVMEGYEADCASRAPWLRRMQAAMDLALQLSEAKSFPWPGASNVAFPLVTIATLQFHSRAYPALVNGPDIVKYRTVAPDPTGEEKQRALRIGNFMSYQVCEEDACWEEQQDRLLINLPIVGCAFKKSYYSSSIQGNKSELVQAKDLVMDYYAKNVDDCERKTHIVPLYRNEMHERMVLGTFRDYTEEAWYQGVAQPAPTTADFRTDRREGLNPPPPDHATPFTTLEQHCWVDFDKDGYAEPYIITVEATTRKVLRIVARWEKEADILRNGKNRIYRINATEYFTKYTFIPAPDNSIYDLGFGILLGPLNESVNSLVNQLIDAGTMANTAGGFLGRGAKVRGGSYTFAPLEWKRVDSTGDDLRKSIFPLPVREPSHVLFQLLSLLVNYTERISSSTDIMVGENVGQNTAKGTVDHLVEQGSKIYTAIFKRSWRGMRAEFKKLFILNSIYLPMKKPYGANGGVILREDFLIDPSQIAPSADPNVVSDSVRLQQAITVKQSAATTPGYDIEAVERNLLQALRVDGVDSLYPGPKKIPAGPSEKIQLEQMRMKIVEMKLQTEMHQFLLQLAETERVNEATIHNLEAQAVKALAGAEGVAAGHQIAAFDAAIGAMKAHNDSIHKRVELLLKSMEGEGNGTTPAPDGAGLPGLATPPGLPGPTVPGPSAEAAPAGAMV